MPKTVLYCLLLISCRFLAGCEFNKTENILREWYVVEKGSSSRSRDTVHLILRLYPKGIYTQFGANNYAIGKWRMNEKGNYIHLHAESGTTIHKDEYLKIELLEREQMQAGLFFKMPFYASRLRSKLQFAGQKNDSDQDPYQPALHEWRVKPARPETEAAIRIRVVQYLHFLASMYQHAMDNDMRTLSNAWYPSPLLMHFGNGVRMAYANELDDWNHCFYDSAQAVKGYQVLSGPISAITLKKGVDKFERNLDCVQQLLRKLEK